MNHSPPEAGFIMATRLPVTGTLQRVSVSIGEMAASSAPNVIISTRSLGSCMAVVLWDPTTSYGGMLHALLPDSKISPQRAQRRPGQFVDTAIPALISQLEGLGASVGSLIARVAGGACVLGGEGVFDVGRTNAARVIAELGARRIPIRAESIGGNESRALHFEVGSGRVMMSILGVERPL